MARKISDKGLARKLTSIVAEKVWERDKGTCQWCGKTTGKLDVSHVIPKSRSTFLRWDMNNLKLLCFNCHMNKWHGRSEGRAWFDKKYPDRAAYIDEHERDLVKKRKFMEERLEELNETIH